MLLVQFEKVAIKSHGLFEEIAGPILFLSGMEAQLMLVEIAE